jgi:YegS/Rv2252/BmrU family lipid kinase
MKIAIILNGVSRKKKFFYREILPPLKQKFDVTVFETQFAQHAIELASKATKEKYDYVLAAGGDGTLNQVLNGIIQQPLETESPAIGIIPFGTGNDFARTCGIKPDANQIAHLLIQNSPKPTDIGKINCRDEHGKELTSYFINVCSIGMGPAVVKRLMKSDRSLGPLLTYLKAITTTFFTHQPQEVAIQSLHWQWRGKMRVAAIANGQSFGNAMFIAPDASPDDGVFSTFVAGDLSLLKFLYCLQKIKGKTKVKDGLIHYNECTSIEITSPEPCPIEAEGELMGLLPMKIEMLPKRIKFLR